jgi:hypothetical protein
MDGHVCAQGVTQGLPYGTGGVHTSVASSRMEASTPRRRRQLFGLYGGSQSQILAKKVFYGGCMTGRSPLPNASRIC